MAAAIQLDGARRVMNGAEAAIYLGRRGWPPAAIHEATGDEASRNTILKAFSNARRRGVKIPRFSKAIKNKVAALWALEYDAAAIAADLEIPVEAVEALMRSIMREAGVATDGPKHT
jgi:hypothetical protein